MVKEIKCCLLSQYFDFGHALVVSLGQLNLCSKIHTSRLGTAVGRL